MFQFFCIRCEGNVVWGTCAGMILLSNSVVGEKRGSQIKVCKMLLWNVIFRKGHHCEITVVWLSSLNFQIGGVGVTTQRNYFGRQIQSFESNIELKDPQLSMVSIIPSYLRINKKKNYKVIWIGWHAVRRLGSIIFFHSFSSYKKSKST